MYRVVQARQSLYEPAAATGRQADEMTVYSERFFSDPSHG